MSAVFDTTTGKIRQLDQKAAPGEVVSEADVANASKLTRLLVRVLGDLASVRRRFWPQRIDYQDLELAGEVSPGVGTTVALTHKFGGRVRWWVVDMATDIPELVRDPVLTTDDTLVLSSFVSCTVTIRIEEAG